MYEYLPYNLMHKVGFVSDGAAIPGRFVESAQVSLFSSLITNISSLDLLLYSAS